MKIHRRIEITGLENDGFPVLNLNPLQTDEKETYLRRRTEGFYSETLLEKCPLCCGIESFLIAEKDRYGLPVSTCVCRECGLIFTLNPLNAESARLFYRDQYRNLYEGTLVNEQDRQSKIEGFFRSRDLASSLSREIPEISRFGPQSLVVEVGASAGWNLAAFQKRNIPVLGADFDPEMVSYGCQKGIRLIEGSVAELLRENARADLLILNHVLEHVGDPASFLSQCRELLKPGGSLFIGVPGLHALRVGEWGSDLQHTLQNAHLFLFDWVTLKRFAAKAGLKPVVGYPLIWSVFRSENLPEKTAVPISSPRGEKVLDYLKTLRTTGPLWHGLDQWLGGSQTKQMLFLRRIAGALARRIWADYKKEAV